VFKTLLSLVRASGLAALIATHNLELAAQMDRRVTIKGGQVVTMLLDGVVGIPVNSVVKTVADCFKFRNKIGLDIAIEALRDAWRQKKSPWMSCGGLPSFAGWPTSCAPTWKAWHDNTQSCRVRACATAQQGAR
jgi:hypothetical protein